MSKDILIPPSIIIGELFPWKGKFWKVQVYDPAGGMVKFYGDTSNQEVNAVCQNPILILEMAGETTGSIKRRKHHD